MPPPDCDRWRVLLSPDFFNLVESELGGFFGRSVIHRLKILHERLLILVGDKLERVADQVDDTELDLRFREHSVYSFRKRFESIDAGYEGILHPTVLQFGHDGQPEVCSLGL